jgi:hypothetical protein
VKKKPETYQIRHSELGVYQGLHKNLLYWYPKSSCPEFGIFEFHSKIVAKESANWIKSTLERLDVKGEVIVEPFDRGRHLELVEVGKNIDMALKVMPVGEA